MAYYYALLMKTADGALKCGYLPDELVPAGNVPSANFDAISPIYRTNSFETGRIAQSYYGEMVRRGVYSMTSGLYHAGDTNRITFKNGA